MVSYWEKEYLFSRFDIIIVGSGIVGLSAAIHLARLSPSSRIGIVERGATPNGASTKNAGFACFGTIGELLDDLNGQTEQDIIDTIRMRWTGLKKLLEMVPKHQMDYLNHGGYELANDKAQFDFYESHLNSINDIINEAIGIKDVIQIRSSQSGMSFYDKMFYNAYESQLNPALMIKSLLGTAKSLGVKLINGFALAGYKAGTTIQLESDNGLLINTNKLILCTNAFTNRLLDGLDIKPARNQVLVTDKIEGLSLKGCFHFERGYVYFRNIDGRILLGGARHIDPETESTDDFGSNPDVLDYLKSFLERIVPNRNVGISQTWSGIIATGASKKPIVCKLEDNIYAAVRLGGMGVAIGSAVGEAIAKLVEEETH